MGRAGPIGCLDHLLLLVDECGVLKGGIRRTKTTCHCNWAPKSG